MASEKKNGGGDSNDEAPLIDLNFMKAESADLLRLGITGLHTDKRTGRRWASREIRAGRLHHGFVVAVEAERPFGEFSLVAVGQAAIVAARYDGRLGVPALFRREIFPLLASLPAASGARQLLRHSGLRVEPFPLPEAAIDIDTPADLAAVSGMRP